MLRENSFEHANDVRSPLIFAADVLPAHEGEPLLSKKVPNKYRSIFAAYSTSQFVQFLIFTMQ